MSRPASSGPGKSLAARKASPSVGQRPLVSCLLHRLSSRLPGLLFGFFLVHALVKALLQCFMICTAIYILCFHEQRLFRSVLLSFIAFAVRLGLLCIFERNCQHHISRL